MTTSANPSNLTSAIPTFGDRLISAKEAAAVLKIGQTKWWEGVKKGDYPKPIKLGPRSTRWSMRSVESLMVTGVHRSPDSIRNQ